MEFHKVPPHPDLIAKLRHEHKSLSHDDPLSLVAFSEFVEHHLGFRHKSATTIGLDDGQDNMSPSFRSTWRNTSGSGPQLVAVPNRPFENGTVHIQALLVEFPDKKHSPAHSHNFYQQMFSNLDKYYSEVSGGSIRIKVSMSDWLTLPRPLSFYANHSSGMNDVAPNSQNMAQDAVAVALKNRVPFSNDLSFRNDNLVNALFIIHAGAGAEITGSREDIWSHKWTLPEVTRVADNLNVSVYLTVPEDCTLGVSAHELGHLAFEWDDFYDANYDEDHHLWAGSGNWDLMASGSYNGNSQSPAHPAGLHKMQHNWVETQLFSTPGQYNVTLAAYRQVAKVVSPAFGRNQFLLLEVRERTGFDSALPGEGLLLWKIDTDREQVAPMQPAMTLIQADGRMDLESNRNSGDDGDPFPGVSNCTRVLDMGRISTSFSPYARSGISISSITYASGRASFVLTIARPRRLLTPNQEADIVPTTTSTTTTNDASLMMPAPTCKCCCKCNKKGKKEKKKGKK